MKHRHAQFQEPYGYFLFHKTQDDRTSIERQFAAATRLYPQTGIGVFKLFICYSI